jgi:hypothetical protein
MLSPPAPQWCMSAVFVSHRAQATSKIKDRQDTPGSVAVLVILPLVAFCCEGECQRWLICKPCATPEAPW